MPDAIPTRRFTPAGFFVLRSPLLPLSKYLCLSDGLTSGDPKVTESEAIEWERNVGLVEAALVRIVSDPVVREALYLASPGLVRAIDQAIGGGHSKKRTKALSSVMRYMARMAARPTPFGLFAGVSVGRCAQDTKLVLVPNEEYRRVSSVDGAVLMEVFDQLHRDRGARRASRWRVNSSVYRVGDFYRYAEAQTEDDRRSYVLAALPSTPHLDAVLGRAFTWVNWTELASALTPFEATATDVEAFLDELVDARVLVSEHEPSASGTSRLPDLLPMLDAVDGDAGTAWRRVIQAVAALDAHGIGAAIADYQAYETDVALLAPKTARTERLVQTVLVKPSPTMTLGSQVIAVMEKAVRLLHRISDLGGDGELKQFAANFRERYGEQFIPLGEALDHDVGVGFGAQDQAGEAAGLLAGLSLKPPSPVPTMPWDRRDDHKLRRMVEVLQSGEREWVLSEEDVAAISSEQLGSLPDTFSVLCTVVGASNEALNRGDFLLQAFSVLGPSGAETLGRFCDASPELRDHVTKFLTAEEQHRPDAVFAEVVHLPVGRLGNVAFRPSLRRHEISYLGRSELPDDRVLALDDLLVGLDGDRVVLWSPRLEREVVPRLSTAHAAGAKVNLPAYRFLYAVQRHDDVAAEMKWNWGAMLTSPFLPRIRYDRIVLARARWLVYRDELPRDPAVDGAELWRAMRSLRATRGLPRMVLLAEGDNQLLLDLDNPVSIRIFASMVRARDVVVLLEQYPDATLLPLVGPEGAYTHEIFMPFVCDPSPRAAAAVSARVALAVSSVDDSTVRAFLPGSAWRYLKIYCGTGSADALVTDVIQPVLGDGQARGGELEWFWLRYADPNHHLRVRFRGDSVQTVEAAQAKLLAGLDAMVQRRLVSRVELAMYERELERYGGPQAMELVERLFAVDGPATAHVIAAWKEARLAMSDRWQVALKAVDDLWVSFGMNELARHAIAQHLAASHGGAFRAELEPTRNRLSQRERTLRPLVVDILRRGKYGGESGVRLAKTLRDRAAAMTPIAGALCELSQAGCLLTTIPSLVGSLSHMTVNRLLPVAQRPQEAVLYHLLWRYYEATRHRNHAAAAASP